MFIPLNFKTDYSLSTSLIKIKDLINFCVQKKIIACGICDNNLSGSIEFYKLCHQNNIKPIIGLTVTINGLVIYLYAKNYNGYKNLLKINTLICEKELTKKFLDNYIDDLIVVIPIKSSELFSLFNSYKEVYLSYKNKNELEEILKLTKNVVYLNEIKYFNKEDQKYLAILSNMAGNILTNEENESYINNQNEFDIANTNKFSSLINISIPFNKRYIPIYDKSVDSFKYLVTLANTGIKKRLEVVSEIYQERLNYELEVIKKMGFVDYFLIVYDYVLFAKKHNILVGPGRGSAAGSLVSYSIGITDIDPIKYDLLFERFLNESRSTMPDIDIDFESTRRDEVINYVISKYGRDYVSAGLTYSTYKTRLVLLSVSKYFNVSQTLMKKFLMVINREMNLTNNLLNPDVKKFLTNYEELKEVYEVALKLEDIKKNISTHAAGLVISNCKLDDIIPMYKHDDIVLTGVTMEFLEDLGLLKMDFLALKNLTTIENIISKIPDFDLKKIDLEDKSVYELFKSANTDGIFQFETPAFKRVLPIILPEKFSDLVAAIALIRPGPSHELTKYINRKNHKERVVYYNDKLKDILGETYGVIIYQEQVIRILNLMGNFSNAEADNIRRAMSKKKSDIIENYRQLFIKRSISFNYKEEEAIKVFDAIKQFALYGFNKAHSVSYATVSYQMAYLKVHYKYLFTFNMLNELKGNPEKAKKYLNDIKNDGIILVTPSFNYSTNEYIIKNKFLYLPFKTIINLNNEVINNIILEKTKGSFKSIYEVFIRCNEFMNKSIYEQLIYADVFKEFKYNKRTLIENLDSLINYATLYNELGEVLEPEITIYEELNIEEIRSKEILSYGFYITNHPASKFISKDIIKLNEINNYMFKNIKVAVIIDKVHKIKTKKNEDMAFLNCSDETKDAEFTLFPSNYKEILDIKVNDLVYIYGRVSKRFDKVSIIINKIERV